MNRHTTRIVAWLAIAAAACGGPSSREVFTADVVPILEAQCLSTACHGVSLDAEERGEVIDWTYFRVRMTDDMRVADMQQAYAVAKERINTVEAAVLSSLVRKPLAVDAGGTIHRGGSQFAGLDAPKLAVLLGWIRSENDGEQGAELTSLTPEEQLFARDVQPLLAAGQCMSQACHGPFSPFTRFAPPMNIDGTALFSVADTVKNYASARMHLFLGGDPYQSRLIRKVVPLGRGGIVHRGGNDIFFATESSDPRADPALQAIARWADAERSREVGEALPEVEGVVYVRGPARSQRAFGHDGFVPGSDLFVLDATADPGTPRNLTATLHPSGPADVRDPAVSHDGRAVAFAMRTSVDDALNIYQVQLDGTGFRQLTFDAADTADAAALPGGGVAVNAQPTYGPDGRIYFVSTRAGQLADGYDQLDTDIWALDPSTTELERMNFEPSPTATPSFIGVGKSYGTLSFTMRRTLGGRYEAPVFRVPLDHNKAFHGDAELHIHHGVTIAEDIVYSMRTLPDGRFSCVLMDRANRWRGGRLAVFDRQIGPEMPRGVEDQAGMGGYRHAFAYLDPDVEAGGISAGGFYRHPVPLPDGRLLVTRATGPVDLDDADAAPEMGLYIVTLDETASETGPRIGASELVVDEAGIAEYDAEPIVRRPLEDDPTHALGYTPGGETAILAFRHVQVLSALFTNLEPRGAKVLRDDLAFARLIQSMPTTPNQAVAAIGESAHGRVRILGEFPLIGDSLFLRIPANTPFRVQFLNAERMAVGAQQNRWIDAAPGETFPGGVSPRLYPVLCAVCHGSLDGDPGGPGGVGGPVPDIITAASVTLATHENLNTRRPLQPLPMDDEPMTVDYQRDIGPVVARACAVSGCHVTPNPTGGLDLTATATAQFDSAYESLLKPGAGSGGARAYVDADGSSANASYLMELLMGRELGAARVLAGPCGGREALSAEEKLMFIRWIDTGAPFRGADW